MPPSTLKPSTQPLQRQKASKEGKNCTQQARKYCGSQTCRAIRMFRMNDSRYLACNDDRRENYSQRKTEHFNPRFRRSKSIPVEIVAPDRENLYRNAFGAAKARVEMFSF